MVDLVGSSGKIKIYAADSCQWAKLSWGKIEEIDSDGKVVQRVNNFASNDHEWSEPQYIDVDSEPFLSAVEAGSTLTILNFHSDLKVADDASLDIDVWIAEKETTSGGALLEENFSDESPGNTCEQADLDAFVAETAAWPGGCCCLNPGGQSVCTAACNNGLATTVLERGAEFFLTFKNWPFLDAANSLRFSAEVHYENNSTEIFSPNSDLIINEFNAYTEDANGAFVADVAVDVTTWFDPTTTTTYDYSATSGAITGTNVNVPTVVNKQHVEWVFPSFTDTLVYDPFITLPEIVSSGVSAELSVFTSMFMVLSYWMN